MMKISMKHKTVVSTSVLILRHGIINDFMDLFGSKKDAQKGLNNLLVVSNIYFGFDVCGCFFNDLIDSVSEVGDDLNSK